MTHCIMFISLGPLDDVEICEVIDGRKQCSTLTEGKKGLCIFTYENRNFQFRVS